MDACEQRALGLVSIRRLARLLAPALLLALGAAVAAAAGDSIAITFVHTNDIHGAVLGDDRRPGTLPALYDLVTETRQGDESPLKDSLLLDAGDLMEGTALDFLTRGRMMMDTVTSLGYDAWTLGNHDFWVGRPDLAGLVAEARRGGVAVLGANVIDLAAGRVADDLAVPYALFERDGVRIAVVGLANGFTDGMNGADKTEGLDFTNPVKALAYWAPRIDGADVTVVLAHLGLGGAGALRAADLAGIPGSVKVIIDSHSHDITWKPRRVALDDGSSVLVVQAGSGLSWAGRLTLWFDASTHKPLVEGATVAHRYEMVDLRKRARALGSETVEDLSSLAPAGDADVRAGTASPMAVAARTWARFAAPHAELLERSAGRAGVDMGRTKPGEVDPLGNLVADGLCAEARRLHGAGLLADILPGFDEAEVVERLVGVETPRSLRGSIPAGDEIRYGGFLQHLPFDNKVAVLAVRGTDLRRLLEFCSWNGVRGGVLVGGLTALVDPRAPAGSRLSEVTVHGRPLADDETYVLATTDFIAAGGAGWGHARLADRPRVVSPVSARDAAWAHLLAQPDREALGADVNETRLATTR